MFNLNYFLKVVVTVVVAPHRVCIDRCANRKQNTHINTIYCIQNQFNRIQAIDAGETLDAKQTGKL